MIEGGLPFLAAIVLLTTAAVWLHARLAFKQVIPAVLVVYALVLIVAHTPLWHTTDAIEAVRTRSIGNVLPAMLFLMMLRFDAYTFVRLGFKTLVAFFLTTASIISAFMVVFWVLGLGQAQSLATLAGSWSGGSANMLAVASVLKLSPTLLGEVIVVDTILYGVWLMLLLALAPLASRFNTYVGAHVDYTFLKESCPLQDGKPRYAVIILLAVSVAFLVNGVAAWLPTFRLGSVTLYAVLLATLLGLVGSFTKLKTLQGTQAVGDNMLLLIIALMASQAHILALETLGGLFIAALGVLAIHALLMVGFAKLLKLDLFSLGVASLAHIGGIASAPLLASSYHKNLIPVGVVMATAGYLLGTVVGLGVAWALGCDF